MALREKVSLLFRLADEESAVASLGAIPGAEVIIAAKMNPGWPTAEEPRHRFDKELDEAPWRDTVVATIYLEDRVWHLLGWPKELRVVISPSPE